MRDLLFKAITSSDKKRKALSSSETYDRQGVRNVIRRHLVCIAREIKDASSVERPLPYMYVLRIINHKEQKEKFFCRIKGSVLLFNSGKLFIVSFMHSLKISISAIAHCV
ncbi:MAG: hypothetical protein C4540_05955 [Candidatus Omnitrophota bacterium]|jgi:hypothetical protein|nr:MAG: hypothetical protein C4540_05955 [Candidatus Omnitrophota bacterium]